MLQALSASGFGRQVCIALGGNIEGSLDCITTAAIAIKGLAISGTFRSSYIYLTEPVGGPANQSPFFNAVVLFDSDRSFHSIFGILQDLELQAGRSREVPNGPRSLDLDFLWYGDVSCNTDVLRLPHPRICDRRFVLEPLCSIDPQVVPPGQSMSASELLDQLVAKGLESPPVQFPTPPSWPR